MQTKHAFKFGYACMLAHNYMVVSLSGNQIKDTLEANMRPLTQYFAIKHVTLWHKRSFMIRLLYIHARVWLFARKILQPNELSWASQNKLSSLERHLSLPAVVSISNVFGFHIWVRCFFEKIKARMFCFFQKPQYCNFGCFLTFLSHSSEEFDVQKVL